MEVNALINGKIRLSDESIEFIRDEHDFIQVITDQLGFDAGEMVKELVYLAQDTEQRINTDLNSYESELEAVQSSFRDIHNITGNLIDSLGERRLNRKKLETLVLQIQTEISKYV